MKRLEVVCDAIAFYNHYNEPESEAYELRNPGMLIADSGKRTFNSHRAGYAALLDRVQKYCQQHKEENVELLLLNFGVKMKLQQERTIDFMARCANTNALKRITSLAWFLEDEHGNASAASSR